ncbi:TPM domain-containing protein [Streptococcus gallolyticus]|uniref:TPM domain-containing protein n=1 Tax=Streptococcus gallolyticus TaxID=315405 RepID=UPI002284F0ED|nr:TPM domain-containing protein [Streptococcus gallolyticus]MCY7187335.1 TPM domain-containing protein [Streptococcus gallolyticus subsp. gallolyticus]
MRRKNKSTKPLTKTLKVFFVAFLIVFGLSFAKGVAADSIPDKAPASGVYDPNGYLSRDVVKKVERLNEKYRKMEKKPQIAVAIIDSLDGNLEEVANKTIRNWKVGYKETNMGLLVLVAVKDKKIRTETSNELATVLTDSDTSKLNDLIKPYFRKSDYSGGMDAYLDGLDVKFATAFSGESGEESGAGGSLKDYISELAGFSSEENSDKTTKKLRELVELVFVSVSVLLFGFIIPVTLIRLLLRSTRYSSGAYYNSSSSYSSSNHYYDNNNDDKYIKKGSQTSQNRSKKKSHDNDSDDVSGSGGGVFFGGSSWDSGSSFDSGSSWSSGGGFDSGSSWDGGGFDGGGSSGDW